MIITVFPQPTGEVIDRMNIFRTAITFFGIYTEDIMLEDMFKLHYNIIKKVSAVQKCTSVWIVNDGKYRLRKFIWGEDSEINMALKSIFNFVFGFSVDAFNDWISSTAVDSQCVSCNFFLKKSLSLYMIMTYACFYILVLL
jgi:hypothetical protein